MLQKKQQKHATIYAFSPYLCLSYEKIAISYVRTFLRNGGYGKSSNAAGVSIWHGAAKGNFHTRLGMD
jgi:hypothetical protein